MQTPFPLLEYYQKGQLLKADDVNALIAVARRQMKIVGGGSFSDPDAAYAITQEKQDFRKGNSGLYFKNLDSEDCPPGGVLSPTTPIAISDEIGYEAGMPAGGGFRMMIANDVFGIAPSNGYGGGRFCWQGAWCLFEGDDPDIGQRWGIEDASWALTQPGSGDFIALGDVMNFDGYKLGRFVQPLAQKRICVTNSTLTQGGSCEVERLQRVTGTPPWERSGETFTAYDIFLNTGEECESGTIVGVISFGGVETVDSMYCAASDWLEA